MKRKKIASLVVTGFLAVGLVGGSLAWFTSQDDITNTFTTDGTNPDDSKAGIVVEEQFNGNENWTENDGKLDNLMPGATVGKNVRVTSTEIYDQYIRAKLIITLNGKPVKVNDSIINVVPNEKDWLLKNDGYYYYRGIVGATESTANIINKVTLSSEAGNEYKNAKIEVKVEAEGIQAANHAVESWYVGAEAELKPIQADK